jgi:hypothetical protein
LRDSSLDYTLFGWFGESKTTATADPYGMTNKRTGNGTDKGAVNGKSTLEMRDVEGFSTG